jgi:hypothetical protein
MDKELREYVRRVSLPALTFDVQADLQAADDAQPMLEADANALEGRLLMQLEADDEAERELTAVLKRWPNTVWRRCRWRGCGSTRIARTKRLPYFSRSLPLSRWMAPLITTSARRSSALGGMRKRPLHLRKRFNSCRGIPLRGQA